MDAEKTTKSKYVLIFQHEDVLSFAIKIYKQYCDCYTVGVFARPVCSNLLLQTGCWGSVNAFMFLKESVSNLMSLA